MVAQTSLTHNQGEYHPPRARNDMVLDWLGGSKDADALMARRKYPQAIDALRQLLQKHGGDLRLRMKLADALVLAGREKEAAPVLLELADALAAEGQAAKSIALLKKVQKIDPGRADVEGKLADLIKTKERRTKGFDPQGEKVTFHEELWPRFIYAAIAVFLLDLLVRRVRLFDRKFVPRGGPRTRAPRAV